MGVFIWLDLDGKVYEVFFWRFVIYFFFNGIKLDVKRVLIFIY